eukprot:6879762-Ditylum_brightwellii.AAC.1
MTHTNNEIIEIIEEEPDIELDFKDPDKHRSCPMSKWALVQAILASLCSEAACSLGKNTDGDDD